MDTERRRCRITLSTLGTGVIAFGVWSVLKTYLYLWVDAYDFDKSALSPKDLKYFNIAVIIFVTVMLLVDFGLRSYVGLSARAVSMGKRKSIAYIVVAALMLASNIFSWILVLMGRTSARLEKQSTLDFYVSTFVDLTSMAMLAELLYNALRLRRLEKLTED